MVKKDNMKLALRFLVYEDPGDPETWLARCLEMDILVHGNTPDQAVYRLVQLAIEHISFCIRNQYTDQIFRPAHGRFLQSFFGMRAKEIKAPELPENSPVNRLEVRQLSLV